MPWQGTGKPPKIGKNGDFPGSGPKPGKRHFARSLPKTLHFFATFPILSNGCVPETVPDAKPSNFACFAGRAETCKIRAKSPFFPDFRGFRNKVKTAVFTLFRTSKFDGFSRLFRQVATRDFTILRKIEKTRATHNFATFSRKNYFFNFFSSLTKSRNSRTVSRIFSWTHDRFWKC